MIECLIFAVFSFACLGFFSKNILKIKRNISLGRNLNRSDKKAERLKTMLLVAFGQQKMFSRPLPAILHLFIYVAFMITSLELLEIFADGLSGNHRLFRSALGSFYTFIVSFIEILSVLALIATFVFLSRRNLLKIPRFQMSEMKDQSLKLTKKLGESNEYTKRLEEKLEASKITFSASSTGCSLRCE